MRLASHSQPGHEGSLLQPPQWGDIQPLPYPGTGSSLFLNGTLVLEGGSPYCGKSSLGGTPNLQSKSDYWEWGLFPRFHFHLANEPP